MCKVKLLNMINVHDCGTLINPQLAAAQVHGGMSMAIGYGLSEKLLFDPKTGRPLNNNLLDYKLSTIMDHPHLEAQFVENAEPTSPFGTKALGEPPTCPARRPFETRSSTRPASPSTKRRSPRTSSLRDSKRTACCKERSWIEPCMIFPLYTKQRASKTRWN
jgi:xanthine dehydrogenase molybdopterin-binding subunit B